MQTCFNEIGVSIAGILRSMYRSSDGISIGWRTGPAMVERSS